jgi:hypothetical protein
MQIASRLIELGGSFNCHFPIADCQLKSIGNRQLEIGNWQ